MTGEPVSTAAAAASSPTGDPPILPAVAASPTPSSDAGPDGVRGYVVVLSALAGIAGLIHLVVTLDHLDEDRLEGAFFAIVGACQIIVAQRIYRRPAHAATLKAAALGSVVVALLWIVSRTVGLPVGPEAGTVAKVGFADSIATLLELALAAIVAGALRGARWLGWFETALATRVVTALLSAALMAAAVGGHEH